MAAGKGVRSLNPSHGNVTAGAPASPYKLQTIATIGDSDR